MSIGIAAVILVFCLSNGITGYVDKQLASSMNALQMQVVSEASISSSRIEDIEELEGVDYVAEGTYVRMSSFYDYGGDEGTIMLLSSAYDALDRDLTAGEICEDGEILISEALRKIFIITRRTKRRNSSARKSILLSEVIRRRLSSAAFMKTIPIMQITPAPM